jgi:hypothetical protein
MDEMIEKKVGELNYGLYGPRFCDHCQKVQPVQTYKLAGSDFMHAENSPGSYKVVVGFTGSHVCTVCYRTIEVNRPSLPEGEK